MLVSNHPPNSPEDPRDTKCWCPSRTDKLRVHFVFGDSRDHDDVQQHCVAGLIGGDEEVVVVFRQESPLFPPSLSILSFTGPKCLWRHSCGSVGPTNPPNNDFPFRE